MNSTTSPELTQFAEDVLAGLSASPKHLSSRYFYDNEGSRLFMEIMKLLEYYPTRAELKIFEDQKEEIRKAFSDGADEAASAAAVALSAAKEGSAHRPSRIAVATSTPYE